MKDKMVRRAASTMITSLLLGTSAAMTTAPAHADAQGDSTFIAYLDKKGFQYEDRTQIIRLAKQFCLDQTRQGIPIWLPLHNLQQKYGWTSADAQTFVAGAINVYCPKIWGG